MHGPHGRVFLYWYTQSISGTWLAAAMADSENPSAASQANPAAPPGAAPGGLAALGAEAAGWVKALASPRVAPGGGADVPGEQRAAVRRTPPPLEPPPGAVPGSGRWRWEPDPGHGGADQPGAGAAAAAAQRFSTRPSGFEGRDAHKRFAMPCITLREDTRGNVTLFGMEPGGALEALGTVRSGDIIVQVDGKPALGRTEKQVRGLLVGEKGSVCTIHWVPPDKVPWRPGPSARAFVACCGTLAPAPVALVVLAPRGPAPPPCSLRTCQLSLF